MNDHLNDYFQCYAISFKVMMLPKKIAGRWYKRSLSRANVFQKKKANEDRSKNHGGGQARLGFSQRNFANGAAPRDFQRRQRKRWPLWGRQSADRQRTDARRGMARKGLEAGETGLLMESHCSLIKSFARRREGARIVHQRENQPTTSETKTKENGGRGVETRLDSRCAYDQPPLPLSRASLMLSQTCFTFVWQ